MEDKRVRICDIAKELGLSTATVSNVIHGKTKKISDETVKRVQELIEKRNYIPNMAGILLAQNNSKIIGVVINNHPKYEGHVLEDAFISASLNTLAYEIEKENYFMMVKTTSDWNNIIKIASMWNMEGLVLIGFCEQDYKSLREKMHIPFVVYDGFFPDDERICNIVIDNYDGGYQAGKYLSNLGHEKVACISDNDICMDAERIKGLRAGLNPKNLECFLIPQTREGRKEYYKKNMVRIMNFTAIFAVSDFYAAELIHYLVKCGKKIPEDISIIGFDDIIPGNYYMDLTTVRQNIALRAKTAIDALLKMKNGNCQKSKIILPVKLVVRGSTTHVH